MITLKCKICGGKKEYRQLDFEYPAYCPRGHIISVHAIYHTGTQRMSQEELLSQLRADNPNNRYAKSTDGWCIGVYNEDLGRFRVIAHSLLSDPHSWVYQDKEIFINGGTQYKPEDWLE